VHLILPRWLAGGRSERGTNSLELAFIAMFLFICIAGIVDIGGAYQHYIVVINASREGARTYARLPCTAANRTAVKSAIVSATLGEAARSSVNLLSNNIVIAPDPSASCPANGALVRVVVRDDYETLLGAFWNATTFPIRAQTSMMFYGTD
jgi:Flp pilus assembly protein TadG